MARQENLEPHRSTMQMQPQALAWRYLLLLLPSSAHVWKPRPNEADDMQKSTGFGHILSWKLLLQFASSSSQHFNSEAQFPTTISLAKTSQENPPIRPDLQLLNKDTRRPEPTIMCVRPKMI